VHSKLAAIRHGVGEEEGMGESLVREESPVEFFREQLSRAMDHQKVSTSAFTEYYLVNLLAEGVSQRPGSVGDPGEGEMPLALLYVRAFRASRAERARLLRTMGDTALFVSGFFADSLHRKLVDLDYYRTLGGRAYAHLSRAEELSFGPQVFGELARRFMEFADLLAEVSEQSRLTSVASVLRLYERWQQTGSRRAARLLAERGIAPIAGGRPQ
jgi:hypothetical protein